MYKPHRSTTLYRTTRKHTQQTKAQSITSSKAQSHYRSQQSIRHGSKATSHNLSRGGMVPRGYGSKLYPVYNRPRQFIPSNFFYKNYPGATCIEAYLYFLSPKLHVQPKVTGFKTHGDQHHRILYNFYAQHSIVGLCMFVVGGCFTTTTLLIAVTTYKDTTRSGALRNAA